ncbi:hypothetical protein K474DRAFT_1684379 [Panus rudis PR-1116 ss-1]|nr:hypothetical protein K474DRAFT_1684379 [Panus rudis PR-1116 ss-1]
MKSHADLYREYNVVVLGAGGVGKSALTFRFVCDQFLSDYNPTIEEQYRRSMVKDGQTFVLEILDTAGAEQFTALNEVYIKSGHGFVLVFSLTQESSIQDIDNIRQQIQLIKGGAAREREVTQARIRELVAEWRLPVYETSAKNNVQVKDVFDDLLDQMRAAYPNQPLKSRKRRKKASPCIIM